MSSNSIYDALASALPRLSRQSSGELPTLPDSLAVTDVSENLTRGGTASDLLQATLHQASDAISQNSRQLSDLQTLQQQLLATIAQNTQAVSASTQTKGTSSGSALETVGGAISGLLGGSILTPIVTGLMGMFGGSGSDSSTPVYTPFTMPAPVQVSTVVNSAVAQPRSTAGAASSGGAAPAAMAPTQVQVNVNAIDSRSFLDHSDAIADAVRQALLHSHSLGDVIARL